MTDKNAHSVGTIAGRRKLEWNAPKLVRIEAGSAETGFTKAVADGGFTTS